jgi:hypothetical protein
MSSKGFELVTSQAKAKSNYRYTTCVFISTSITKNMSTTFLTKLTCYPCTMHSSRYVSAFRPRGVPGPTSKLSPRAPAQMGRRETEREGGEARGRQA